MNMNSLNSLFDMEDCSLPQSPILLREDLLSSNIPVLDADLNPEREELPLPVEETEALHQQQHNPVDNAAPAQPAEDSGIIDITKEGDGSDDSDSDIEILPGATINPLPPLRSASQRRPISARYEPYTGKSIFKQMTSRASNAWEQVSIVC